MECRRLFCVSRWFGVVCAATFVHLPIFLVPTPSFAFDLVLVFCSFAAGTFWVCRFVWLITQPNINKRTWACTLLVFLALSPLVVGTGQAYKIAAVVVWDIVAILYYGSTRINAAYHRRIATRRAVLPEPPPPASPASLPSIQEERESELESEPPSSASPSSSAQGSAPPPPPSESPSISAVPPPAMPSASPTPTPSPPASLADLPPPPSSSVPAPPVPLPPRLLVIKIQK